MKDTVSSVIKSQYLFKKIMNLISSHRSKVRPVFLLVALKVRRLMRLAS